MKTERLYYTDCYARQFEARVVKAEPDARGARVYLDRTAFYPESGGQPSDRGLLGGVPVLEAVDEGDAIAHVLERAPKGEILRGEIDWARRFDHMQQHTGQHILSAAFEKTSHLKTISFHLGAEVSAIDLDSERLVPRQIQEAEDLANGLVFENRVVRISFRPAAEVSHVDLRKPTEREGTVRLIEVEDFDLSACGGTHVSRTGEIGMILAGRFERVRGGTRVEFVCGGRALQASRRALAGLSEAARAFSTSLEQVPGQTKKLLEDLRGAAHVREKLMKRLVEYRGRELRAAAPEKRGRKIVRQVFAAEDHAEAKLLAHALAAEPDTVALIGVAGKPAALYFAQCRGGASDMASLLREVLGRVGGKGGGTRDFAQGGGLDESRLEEALRAVETLL